jgi:hypothetical protein
MALKRVVFSDFHRGVDLASAPSDVKSPFVPGAVNATSRGRAAVQRWGVNPLGQTTAEGQFLYHSPIFPTTIFVQEGTTLYTYVDAPGLASRTSRKVFSTSAKISACDFVTGAGATPCVVFVHPVDGVFTWDGTTFSARVGSPIVGTACAVWQNKVWVIDGRTLWWSNEGRADVWTTASDFNAIRDLNDEDLTAIGVGNGNDMLERTGLLVFKRQSTHLVIDSETGEYKTIDTRHGAMSKEAVTSCLGHVFCSNELGIYRVTDNGLQDIHARIGVLWDAPYIGNRYEVAWTVGDRVYFSPGSGDILLEYVVPDDAWWVHVISGASDGVISATGTSNGTSGNAALVPYLLCKAGSATYVTTMWEPPYADGATLEDITGDIQFSLRLPVIEIQHGEIRVDRCFIRGWGGGAGENLTPRVFSNGNDSGTSQPQVTLGGSSQFEDDEIINQLGVHRQFQLELAATAADSYDVQPNTGLGTSSDVSPLGITSVRFDIIELEQ